jgi:hypothetical protein
MLHIFDVIIIYIFIDFYESNIINNETFKFFSIILKEMYLFYS